MVPVPREHPSIASNQRDPSSELTGQLSCTSTPQRALNSWISSRACQLTKDHQKLGACSPRETHMKEPTSAHKLSSYVLLVGTPFCQNAGRQSQNKTQATSRRKNASPGNQHPLQGRKRLAKLSLNTWLNFLSLVFAPRASFLSPTPHGLLAR